MPREFPFLRHRPMRPKDIPACVEMVAEHPVLSQRYGRAIGELGTAWLQVLGCEAQRTTVFEEVEGSSVRMVGFSVSVFVNDEFLRFLKGPSIPWVGAELVRRILNGNSPLLSSRELLEANSTGGLNLLVWEACTRSEHERWLEITKSMVGVWIEQHRGFFWKEIVVGQAESREALGAKQKAGAMLWDPVARSYVESMHRNPGETVREPHLLGVARDAEPEQLVSWLGTLFDYRAPRFRFSRGEQRLLTLALTGGTDKELSLRLGSSLSAVKKMWLAVYKRVARGAPESSPTPFRDEWITSPRGREKKRRLLAYLQTHPEELCPILRKSLWRRTVSAGSGFGGLSRR